MQETQEARASSLGPWRDHLEDEMSSHSSILVWGIPWTEDPGGLQFMELQSWTRLSTLAEVLKQKAFSFPPQPLTMCYIFYLLF